MMMHLRQVSLFVTALSALLGFGQGAMASEDNLFATHCGSCHGQQTDGRIPTAIALARMNPLAVLATMETGSMQIQAQKLSIAQKRQLVEKLTGKKIAALTIPESAYCQTREAPVTPDSTIHWSGWGGSGAGLGYATGREAGLSQAELPQLQTDWVFAFPGVSQARSQPAILDDVLYIGGAEGSVTALDTHTGCIYWRVDTSSAVRGAITLARLEGGVVVFAVASNTDAYALDARSGAVRWKQRAGFHPFHSVTGTPVVAQDKVFVPLSSIEVGIARMPDHHCCISSGGVAALDVASGSVVWQTRSTLREAVKVGESAGKAVFAPSGAPIWASPTVDEARGLIYVGTGENYSRPTTLTSDAIMALRLDDGTLAWSQQMTANDAWHGGCSLMPDYAPCDDPGPDLDFGMAPMVVTAPSGKDLLLAGQKSGVVFALDPDNGGQVIWQTRVGKGSALGGIHWGMATDGVRVYVPNADRPTVIKDVNPEREPTPGLYALDVLTGAVVWSVPSPGPSCKPDPSLDPRERRTALRDCLTAHSAAPTVIDGVVFAGDLYGTLRAHDAATGKVLWTYDSNRNYDTRNGVEGRGGSIDGPGPVIINGRLFLNSGYGSFGQRAGNVLISIGPGATEPDTAGN